MEEWRKNKFIVKDGDKAMEILKSKLRLIKDKDAEQQAEQDSLAGQQEEEERAKYEQMEEDMKQDEYEQVCQEGYGDFS